MIRSMIEIFFHTITFKISLILNKTFLAASCSKIENLKIQRLVFQESLETLAPKFFGQCPLLDYIFSSLEYKF